MSNQWWQDGGMKSKKLEYGSKGVMGVSGIELNGEKKERRLAAKVPKEGGQKQEVRSQEAEARMRDKPGRATSPRPSPPQAVERGKIPSVQRKRLASGTVALSETGRNPGAGGKRWVEGGVRWGGSRQGAGK